GFAPKISETVNRLGKSPADALDLYRSMHQGFTDFDFAAVSWSPDQVWTAFELACLCGLKVALSNPSGVRPAAVATIALWYSEVMDLQLKMLFQDMYPDYRRGKKSRERGKSAHKTWVERYKQAEKFRKLDYEQTKTRSALLRHKRIAAKLLGGEKAYKTVERRLKE